MKVKYETPHCRQMRRRRGALLCFNFDCKPGLEFHGEVVVVNGDLLDQLSGEAFVEFDDFGLLTSGEALQLVDVLPGLLAAAGVCLGL